MAAIVVQLSAQNLPDYNFLCAQSEYIEISDGIILGNRFSDNQIFVSPNNLYGGSLSKGEGFTIGFNFVYNGNLYDRLAINNNGWISLGMSEFGNSAVFMGSSTAFNAYSTIPDYSYLSNVVAAFNCDLKGNLGSLLMIKTLGIAPERVCVVQWKGYRKNNSISTSEDNINFQIRLYETTNIIKFHYGFVHNGNYSASIRVGLRGSDATDFTVRKTTNNWLTSTTGIDYTDSCILSTTVYPQDGLSYIFFPPTPPENDLAVLSISGNQVPSQNSETYFTVRIKNNSRIAQTNYSIKIMTGNTELTSIQGPLIQPLQMLNVSIPWTPLYADQFLIYAKVFLLNDEIESNNNGYNYLIRVAPLGLLTYTIGDVISSTNSIPFCFENLSDGCGYFQTIIPAEELISGGLLSGISLYSNSPLYSNIAQLKVLLGVTNQTNLESNWLDLSQLTQVYSDSISFGNGNRIVYLEFTTPFYYSGGNLALALVKTPLGGYTFYPRFAAGTGLIPRSRFYETYQETNHEMLSMYSTSTYFFPKTSFYFSPASVNPQLSVIDSLYDFGELRINDSKSHRLNLYNTSGDTINISSISISGSQYFTVVDQPSFPISLSFGQTLILNVRYNPQEIGEHSGVLSVIDDLGREIRLGQTSVNKIYQGRNLSQMLFLGSCYDANIVQLPYSESFDNVLCPDMPLFWSALQQSGPMASITSTTEDFFSASSSIRFKSINATDPIYLIMPSISSAIPMNNVRLRFQHKDIGVTSSLSVGVISDINNLYSFEEVEYIVPRYNWTEKEVSFHSYSGAGKAIAFRLNYTASNQISYLDNVFVELIQEHDIAITNLKLVSVPVADTPTMLSVDIMNRGLSVENNYVVKIFDIQENELTSVNGPSLAVFTKQTIQFPWVAQNSGPMQIYAKLIFSQDMNSTNDRTEQLSVNVFHEDVTVISIGNGTLNAKVPIDFSRFESICQTIYPSNELNFSGTVIGVSLYGDFNSNLQERRTKIWLGITNRNDLSGGWEGINSFSLVYDGYVYYQTGQHPIIINFDTPYPYFGGNLIMMVARPNNPVMFSYDNNFKCQSDSLLRTRIISTDTILSFPAMLNTQLGSATNIYPKTDLLMFGSIDSLGFVSGYIYNQNNQPVSGSRVYSKGVMTTTNEVGLYRFILSSLQNPHKIIATQSCYEPSVVYEASIIPLQTVTQNLQLGSPVEGTCFMGFDTLNDFSVNLNPWTTVDLDNSDTVMSDSLYYPNMGMPMAYTIINPFVTLPFMGFECLPLSGDKMAACFTATNPPNNDWLISPLYPNNGQNSYISFYTKSMLAQYGLTKFRVAMSTGSTDPNQFTYLTDTISATSDWAITNINIGSEEASQYRIGIQCISDDGYALLVDNFNIEFSTANSNLIPKPDVTKLVNCYPNPIISNLNIEFDIKEQVKLTIEIYNIKGQKVSTLVDGFTKAGKHHSVWNRTDNNGKVVANGVYYCKMTAGDYTKVKKLVLLK
jgi:hypothetical protein